MKKFFCVLATTAALLTALTSTTTSVYGQFAKKPASPKCYFITRLLKQYLPALGSTKWMAFQLRTNGEVKHIVFLDVSDRRIGWVMTTTPKEQPSLACVENKGHQVEVLKSAHNTYRDIEKYGLPGSGHPRCGRKDDILEGAKVRSWASRELGKSMIFGLQAEQGRSFVFLFNPADASWILLEREAGESTCYWSRGEHYDSREMVLKEN